MIGRPGVFEDGNNFVPTFRTPSASGTARPSSPASSAAGAGIFGLFYGLNESGAINAALLPNAEKSQAGGSRLLVRILENVVKRVWKNA